MIEKLPGRLRDLSDEMFVVAVELEYFGGFNLQLKEKSSEMIGAARIARQWADEIEIDLKKNEEDDGTKTPFPAV